MTDSLIQTSFSNGELSPTVFGREDLPKLRAGAATMRNFFVDYRGGASSRAGTRFIGAARYSPGVVRLIRFQFSVYQSYILEFGAFYIRFVTGDGFVLETPKAVSGSSTNILTVTANGWSIGDWIYLTANAKTYIVSSAATNTVTLVNVDGSGVTSLPATGTAARIYTLASPYADTDLWALKFTQSADVMTLTHPSYVPYDLTRLGSANWTISPISFAALVQAPTSLHLDRIPGTVSSAAYYEYVITSVGFNGEESLPSAQVGTFGLNMGTDPESYELTWGGVVGAGYYNIYRAAAFNGFQVPGGAIHGYVGNATGTQFVDTNIVASFTKTPPQHSDPFSPGQILTAHITNQGTGYTSAPTATVSDGSGSGSGAVIQLTTYNNTSVVGAQIINAGNGYVTPICTVTGGGGSGATIVLTAGPMTGTYPSTCSYYQQRRIFAASNNLPETIWGTRPGLFSNMDVSNPVVDSDAFQFTLSSNQVNNIKHMVSMPGGLVVFTGSGVWQLSGGGQNTALTPSNAIANPQSYTGCSDVPPIPINYSILYVQQKGSIVRDIAYNFYANIYTGQDTTVLSNHLFYGHQVVDWAYAEEPFKTIWAARSDGVLLSLAYLKEQEINGWARHDTLGSFESVATIPSTDGTEDLVYFVVRRQINGVLVRYIEVMAQRNFTTGPDSPWCVDAGIQILGGVQSTEAYLSGSTGSVSLGSAVITFSSGNIGQVLRFGGGRGIVTALNGNGTLQVLLDHPVIEVYPNGVPIPQSSWALSSVVSTVSGLDHLNGDVVVGLADGVAFGPVTVGNGAITLPSPASRVIVGLAFQAQLQTMYAEGGQQTIQGKRKQIQAASVRMNQTRGLQVGPAFDQLQTINDTSFGTVDPIALVSHDERVNFPGNWNVYGQVCFQQDLPLPASVLAVTYEINLGN